MKERITDMSMRKGIKIIFPELEVKDYIKDNATLKIKREIKDSCGIIDPLGMCTVIDCLSCKNSDYKIILHDGVILKDFKDEKSSGEEEKYIIEFFDKLDHTTNILDYLTNEENDYRITRESDQVILYYSKEDRQKRDISMNQSRKYIDDYLKRQEELYKEETDSKENQQTPPEQTKNKSLLNKIKSILKK